MQDSDSKAVKCSPKKIHLEVPVIRIRLKNDKIMAIGKELRRIYSIRN